MTGNNFNRKTFHRKTYHRHIFIDSPLNSGTPEFLMIEFHYNLWLTTVITSYFITTVKICRKSCKNHEKSKHLTKFGLLCYKEMERNL